MIRDTKLGVFIDKLNYFSYFCKVFQNKHKKKENMITVDGLTVEFGRAHV